MQLRRFNNIQEFWHNAQDYLLQYEAEHNLLLGISHTLLHYPDRYPDSPYLAIAHTKGKILAAAIRTPPNKLVLSKAEDLNAIALIAQDLQDDSQQLPGVSGLVAEVETFLQIWQTLIGQSYRRVMAMRIHQLTQVEPVATVSGNLRLATESDRSLLTEWFTNFIAEVGEVISQDVEQAVNTGLKRQSIHLWSDGIPVSWASGSKSLPAAARIGPVYTPPEYRGKGYATACVAALSQKLLDYGCDRCFLFTDLANPTSNYIYQKIGYHSICDWHDYSFI
ncbi:GNAT family N-acetyltransferase [Nostoc sp. 106C]|uniref:GNAT family N-acetyltransferase n=1 Tax=Nostoc sp. 106C TaxID=1932667 RepID=UPI000A3BB5E2|nr:GNAT family N-acetyltransferase [Nostoc sp. 106C]OUL25764.1 GNAT family N-acetyltransferase [Nostoc sp. 106C]